MDKPLLKNPEKIEDEIKEIDEEIKNIWPYER